MASNEAFNYSHDYNPEGAGFMHLGVLAGAAGGAWVNRDPRTDPYGLPCVTVVGGPFVQDYIFQRHFVQRSVGYNPLMPWSKKLGGTTKVGGTPVQRTVRLYRRSDGMFIAEFTSRPDGVFNRNGVHEGESYVLVCLDDVAPDDYNDLIYAQVVPVDTVAEDPEWGKDAGS